MRQMKRAKMRNNKGRKLKYIRTKNSLHRGAALQGYMKISHDILKAGPDGENPKEATEIITHTVDEAIIRYSKMYKMPLELKSTRLGYEPGDFQRKLVTLTFQLVKAKI